jgi:hypothetical protein
VIKVVDIQGKQARVNQLEVPESTTKQIYRLIYSDGSAYTGETDQTRVLRQGQGTMLWANGRSYNGNWLDDKMDG